MSKEMNEELIADIRGWFVHDKEIRKMFTKKTYEDEFNFLYDTNLPSIIPWCERYDAVDDEAEKAAVVNEAADIIMEFEKVQTANPKNGKQNNTRISEESMFVALFAIPALSHTGTAFCDKLCDELIPRWHKQYPKNLIQRAKYEVLLNGFKKSILSTLFGRRNKE